MSVQHFIQTIWSKKIQDDLEEKCKLVQDCTREYEGDCDFAQTVKILAVGDPTIGDYIGQDIDIEEMTDDSQDLVIDVQNYFAFQVNDVDKAQSMPGLPDEYQKKSRRKLALKREKFIGALVAGKAQSTADEYAKNDTYKPGATTIIVAQSNSQEHIKAALDALRNESGYLFEDNGGKPQFTQPTGGAGGGAAVTVKDIMAIKDPAERQAKIVQNMHLFKKGSNN